MYKFKRLLFQTDGESALLFWLDVERLRLANQSNLWIHTLVIKIFTTYIADGSPFQLGTPSREDLVKLKYGSSDEKKMLWNLKRSIKELIICQKEVLQRLRTYWCQRYISKLEEDSEVVVPTEHSDRKEGEVTHMELVTLDGVPHRQQLVHMPMTIAKRGNHTLAKIVSQIRCHDTNAPHLPEDVQNTTRLAQAISNETFCKMAASMHSVPCGLISSSTYDLFSDTITSTFDTYQYDEIPEVKFNLEPFLCASIRADFTTGNHFLRFLKKIQSNSLAVNNLLFWQSVEIILTQDEMRRWFSAWSLCHLTRRAVDNSNSTTGSPYLNYFEPYSIARSLNDLCHLFLSPKALHRVQLPKDMEEKLKEWITRGLGQGLLLEAQKYAAQVRYASCDDVISNIR